MTKPSSDNAAETLPRRHRRYFADARDLMGDLLDRYEGGTADPIGYPDYSAFADVSELDRFVKKLQEAEAAGAIRIAKMVRNGDQIAHVKLGAVSRLCDLLGLSFHEAMTATSSAEQLPQPPVLGEVLLVLFCPKNRVDPVMGDLKERFTEDVFAKGRKHAKLLFLARVVRSIGPLLWIKLRGAGLIALLLEIGRRWCGLS
jgi:hypothetical protein